MSVKPLVLAWLLLVALTGIAGASAHLIGRSGLGHAPLLVLAAATLVKVRIILSRYLDLKPQPALLNGFGTAAAVIIVTVTASLLLAT